MNLISLNNDQLAHVRSTLQKQANDLMGDMNAAGESNWSRLLSDLANDQYDLIKSIIAELDDCKTPKVIKAPTLQQEPAWRITRSAAKVLKVDGKKLHNLKQYNKLRPGYHFRKEGRNVLWNVATVGQFLSENSH